MLTSILLSACASLPENNNRTESYTLTSTQNTKLGKVYEELKKSHPGNSGFLPLSSGLDAFVARAALSQAAERSIDAQYYLLHDDLTGRLFIDMLVKAADRGVRVRLLVDDMDLEGRDLGAVILDSHSNIEVRIFNPFGRNVSRISQFITRVGTVTRRMHNKSFTVDNQVTVVGGRNIGDEYFEAHPDLAFRDLDVLAIGPVASDVSSSFDKYWNHPLAYPATTLIDNRPTDEQINDARKNHDAFVAQQTNSDYLTALRESSLVKSINSSKVNLYYGSGKVVSDDPEKLVTDRDKARKYLLATELEPYFENIKNELIIFSPYFVPGKRGVAFLKSLRERGVRVRILTNSLASSDVSIVHAGYARYRKDLLRAGIELYEMNQKIDKTQPKDKQLGSGSSSASLHAKSFVLDRKHVFIGSMNLDPRSFVENTEIGIVISATPLANGMAEWFDQNIEKQAFKVKIEIDKDGWEQLRWYGQQDGNSQIFKVEPYTSFWQRFSVGFMRIFPIESQL